ncbi:hypothetical protein NUU61_005350 [Penicillium alfredii]|uniref:Uncharacterized protein n=1 Tax=Penicillium alfredii TaxID=1506179 RepID=A0A9W9F9E6_9EURO|nr:uncharacterized protein NUU61_005350 [Penicillium alfredii]KAJ5095994.1 hypothetical protein NUU61_005350 [Penicillium alfredii]
MQFTTNILLAMMAATCVVAVPGKRRPPPPTPPILVMSLTNVFFLRFIGPLVKRDAVAKACSTNQHPRQCWSSCDPQSSSNGIPTNNPWHEGDNWCLLEYQGIGGLEQSLEPLMCGEDNDAYTCQNEKAICDGHGCTPDDKSD